MSREGKHQCSWEVTFKATRRKRDFLHTYLCHATPMASFLRICTLLRFMLVVIYTCHLTVSLLMRRMFSHDHLTPARLSRLSSPCLAGGTSVGPEWRQLRVACASLWAGESGGWPGCAGGSPASFPVHRSQYIAAMLLSQMSFSIHRIFLLVALSFLF